KQRNHDTMNYPAVLNGHENIRRIFAIESRRSLTNLRSHRFSVLGRAMDRLPKPRRSEGTKVQSERSTDHEALIRGRIGVAHGRRNGSLNLRAKMRTSRGYKS